MKCLSVVVICIARNVLMSTEVKCELQMIVTVKYRMECFLTLQKMHWRISILPNISTNSFPFGKHVMRYIYSTREIKWQPRYLKSFLTHDMRDLF
jgi:hypothetical protein